MSDDGTIRAMIENWANAVAAGDRDRILASHADDLLMYDFPNSVEGLDAYARTWQFFDDSRRGTVTFRPDDLRLHIGGDVAFTTCIVHCDGTTAGAFDFRLTIGLERRDGAWVIVHEHHSVPTRDEVLIGPDVGR